MQISVHGTEYKHVNSWERLHVSAGTCISVGTYLGNRPCPVELEGEYLNPTPIKTLALPTNYIAGTVSNILDKQQGLSNLFRSIELQVSRCLLPVWVSSRADHHVTPSQRAVVKRVDLH